jgi:hypothetical protein
MSRRDWEGYISKLARVYDPTMVANRMADLRRPAKYCNRVTVVDGIRFHSKLESDRYRELVLLKTSADVKWFTMQVPFRIPGGLYRADFLIVWRTLAITVEDTKGYVTPACKLKIASVQDKYGISIRLLRREDVSYQ